MNTPKLLKVREVAEVLRLSTSQIRRYCWSGELPSIRVGRGLRIRETDLARVIEQGFGINGGAK